MDLVIERATILEWPQIEALRQAYFARMGGPVQRRSDSTRWFAARSGEAVLGCYSTKEEPEYNQRLAQDFYIAALPKREGIYVALTMRDHLYAQAQADGRDVLFAVHPDNHAQMQAVLRHGGATPIGVLFLHTVRREAACPQP